MEHPNQTPPTVRIRLFGYFEVLLDGGPLQGLHLRKADRVLAYLALHAPRWVEKEAIASEFWSRPVYDDPEQNLRQSLVYLRRLLGSGACCIESQVGRLRLVLREEQADILEFNAACERRDAKSLRVAGRLAAEPLLEGWNDPWIEPFRERCARRLRKGLENVQDETRPGQSPPMMSAGGPSAALPSGGIVPLNSPLYVARACDTELVAALDQQQSIILIKGARQTGKSSLLARGLQAARARTWAAYHTDCEQFSAEDLLTSQAFYARLLGTLAEQGDHEFAQDADWRPLLGAAGNLERFLRRKVLAATESPVLWALDGVDRLFKTDYYNEFFAFLRGLHTKRATEPIVPWERFTILIATATEAHLYIRDLSQSPFNVGTRIALEDFDTGLSLDLCRRLAPLGWSDENRQRLYRLLGGNSYLLVRGLNEIETRRMDIDTFERLVVQPDSPYRDHLECALRLLAADGDLRADMLAVLRGDLCTDVGFYRLRSAGLLNGASPERARPRCGLYAEYFARHLR